MDTCRTCGVPFVLMQIDRDRKVATFKCPVCGYVIIVRLTVEILEHARSRMASTLGHEEERTGLDD